MKTRQIPAFCYVKRAVALLLAIFLTLLFVFLLLNACGQTLGEEPAEPEPPGNLAETPAGTDVMPPQGGSEEAAIDWPAEISAEAYRQLEDIFADLADRRGPAKAIALMQDAEGILPDELIRDFLDYHSMLCFYLDAPPLEGDLRQVSEEAVEKALGLRLGEFRANCYSFSISEGFLLFDTDAGAVLEALGRQCGQGSGDYLRLISQYPIAGLVNDAALMATWDRLAEYLVGYYDYLAAWPGGAHSLSANFLIASTGAPPFSSLCARLSDISRAFLCAPVIVFTFPSSITLLSTRNS